MPCGVRQRQHEPARAHAPPSGLQLRIGREKKVEQRDGQCRWEFLFDSVSLLVKGVQHESDENVQQAEVERHHKLKRVPLQRPTRFEHSERVGPRSECRLPEAGEAVGAVAKQTDASDAKAEEAEDVDDDEILAERGSTLDFRIAGITWVCNGCGGCLLFLGADLRGENRLEDAIDEGTHPFLKAQRVH
eukprot:7389616-Prymnesium_polylepis.2